jgi:asparagine synthase (glutamine-hydrolysing)
LVWRGGNEPARDIYWQPTFSEPPLTIDFADAKQRVRDLVVAAVERRLESDVPLGAFLSGGLDSTIVVGVMARLLGRRVRTFSIGFAGDPRFDETHYARIAAQAFGTDHTEFQVQPSSVQLIEELVWLHDGPFADSSAIPTYTISKMMREHVTVALSGDGGDELFCGYLRFLAAEAAERIPLALRRGLRHVGGLVPGALPHHSLGARARRFLRGADLPLADRIAHWNSVFAFDARGLLRQEIASQLDLEAPLAWHRTHVDGRGSVLKRVLDDNFQTYLAYDLQQKIDRCSAGNALEVRSPFLDTALIELAGRLPDSHLRRGRTTKRVLRAAFADLVPEPILRRGKMGFGVPLATWFRGELSGYVRELLGREASLHDYLDPRATARLLDEHETRRVDRSPQLWTLLTLEVWLRSLAQASTMARKEAREARVHR